MATKTHTPGPWERDGDLILGPAGKRGDYVRDDGEHVIVAREEDLTICDAEREANGNLIAAAPDLLHGYRLLLELSSRNSYESYRAAVAEIARTEITKAEGRA